jgi:hypothetical protein
MLFDNPSVAFKAQPITSVILVSLCNRGRVCGDLVRDRMLRTVETGLAPSAFRGRLARRDIELHTGSRSHRRQLDPPASSGIVTVLLAPTIYIYNCTPALLQWSQSV